MKDKGEVRAGTILDFLPSNCGFSHLFIDDVDEGLQVVPCDSDKTEKALLSAFKGDFKGQAIKWSVNRGGKLVGFTPNPNFRLDDE
jgi:hypothetical protein